MTRRGNRRSAPMTVGRWLAGGAMAGSLVVVAPVRPADAAGITVGAGCTLDDAIRSANTDTSVGGCTAGSGIDVITLPAGTFTIGTTFPANPAGNGLPIISSHITFNGAGVGATIIDGGGAHRPFFIGGPSGPDPVVVFNDLTIRNGLAQGGNSGEGGAGAGLGGAIMVQRGTVALKNVTLENNQAIGGSSGVVMDHRGGGGLGADAGQNGLGSGGGEAIDAGGLYEPPDPASHGGEYYAGGGGRGSTHWVVSRAGDGLFGGGGGGAWAIYHPSGMYYSNAHGGDGGFGGGGGAAETEELNAFGGDGGFGGGGGAGAGSDGAFGGEFGGVGGFGGGGGALTSDSERRAHVGRGGFGGGDASQSSDDRRGGGGAGFGGALFIKSGSVQLEGVTFTNNSATGGGGFEDGEGRGGALFACTAAEGGTECAAELIDCGDNSFAGNTASTGEADTFGVLSPAAELPCEAPVAVEPEPKFCEGLLVTIDMNEAGVTGIGTDGDDVILGTPDADVINGRDGDDVICSVGGDDEVDGGAGDDQVRAGEGNDTIRGGPGNDRLVGVRGNDRIFGGPGDDTLHGNLGDDRLDGEDGDDRIFGYGGDDFIAGRAGNDRLHGNTGNDIIWGGDGDDWIRGYAGDDVLNGWAGNNNISGNFGDDLIRAGNGDDIVWGADGDDTIHGGPGNDVLHGNSLDDIILGESGNDTIDGGIGADSCDGGIGADTATRCETIDRVP